MSTKSSLQKKINKKIKRNESNWQDLIDEYEDLEFNSPKNFFAKFLPVKEKLEHGDRFIFKGVEMTPLIKGCEPTKKSQVKNPPKVKVKLLLCLRSTELKVGDIAQYQNTKGNYFKGKIKDEKHLELFKDSDGFKVLGEISEDATWVKEYEVFNKYEATPIHTHSKTGKIIYTNKENKKVDLPIYIIKGCCGHYH